VSTEQKIALIEKLVRAGVTAIQATSFVHPRWVPQMADAEAVAGALSRFPGVRFSALIPNQKGYERAVAAGFHDLELTMAASEAFSHKNLNHSLAAGFEMLGKVSRAAERDKVTLRVGFAMSFHCHFEGTIPTAALVNVVRSARERGPWHIALADTDGMAFPNQISAAVNALQEQLGIAPGELALHVHDTYGRGLANVLAGLQAGIREFDTTTAGLGGCPFCPGASGNLATEDLVALLDGMGYRTGIDMEKLLDAAEFATALSSRPYQAHILRAQRPAACELPRQVS
ncbi:MAG TPA: hydroxymethylglutaryl-CoA lyase, partial [Candidatus Dormibacteraeota bacterium]|nr:hydroxymethylglutaryl-CoA lyase [Candidatus Dormibacteraeota bacterium]